jgi:hypothetical protein
MNFTAETSPAREGRTNGGGPKGKPFSDVTHSAKRMTNAGRSSDAGLVPGASFGQRRDHSGDWERGLSRSRPGGWAESLQGSGDAVGVLTGGAGHTTTTKGLTGSDLASMACRRPELRFGRRSLAKRTRSRETRSGERASRGSDLGGMHSACIHTPACMLKVEGKEGSMDLRQ